MKVKTEVGKKYALQRSKKQCKVKTHLTTTIVF